ncbi:MAG: permease [Bacteroidia bacterium]|nr:permease [Bacteroidia bacterium]
MEIRKELQILGWIVVVFLTVFYLPINNPVFNTAIDATLDLSKWYAREHVILCLLPAFLIAGVISVFISQASVIKYFGANAKKWVAYSVASVSGTILAVCSCTVLPLFSSIHKRGAGLGPAIAFLYSGPAINILAIILTARILGFELGIARVIGAVSFSVLIGLIMAFIYRKEEKVKAEEQMNFPDVPEKRPLWQTATFFFTLVIILVFANWGKPAVDDTSGLWYYIWAYKWYVTGLFGLVLAVVMITFLKLKSWQVIAAVVVTALGALLTGNPIISMVIGIGAVSIISLLDKTEESENREWILSSWGFTKQILPLLAIGVVIAGFLLGSTHDNVSIPGVIPDTWVSYLVGGNSIWSNLFASILGAFMYFATLTEVPILQGLIASGMGKGPALALLLAGPSLSLPNMLVIRGVIGNQKTAVYVLLVVILSTIAGLIFGLI